VVLRRLGPVNGFWLGKEHPVRPPEAFGTMKVRFEDQKIKKSKNQSFSAVGLVLF